MILKTMHPQDQITILTAEESGIDVVGAQDKAKGIINNSVNANAPVRFEVIKAEYGKTTAELVRDALM